MYAIAISITYSKDGSAETGVTSQMNTFESYEDAIAFQNATTEVVQKFLRECQLQKINRGRSGSK